MKRQEGEARLSHDHTTTPNNNSNNNYNHNNNNSTGRINRAPHHSDTTTTSSSSSDRAIGNCSSISTTSATTTFTTTAITTTTINTSNSSSGSSTSSTDPTPRNKCSSSGQCYHHHPRHQYQRKTRRRIREPEPEPHLRLQSPKQQPQICCDHSTHIQHSYHNSDHQFCEPQRVHCCCCCCCCCGRCDRSHSDDRGGVTTPTFPHPQSIADNDVSVVCCLVCNNKRDITTTKHNWDVRDIDIPSNFKNNIYNNYSNPSIHNNNININNNYNNFNNINNKLYNSADNNNNIVNENNIYNKCQCYHTPLNVDSKTTFLDASDIVGQRASGPGCNHNKSENLVSQTRGDDPNRSRNTKRNFVRDTLTNGRVKTKQDFYERGPPLNQVPHADQHRKFTHEMLRRYTPSQTRWLKYSLQIIFLYLMIFAPIVLAYPRPTVIEKGNKTVVVFYTAPCRPVSNHQLRRQLGEAYDEERMADSEENVKRSIQMSTLSPTEDEQSNDAEIDEYFNDNAQGDDPGVPINDLGDEEDEEEEEGEGDDSEDYDEDDDDDSDDSDEDDDDDKESDEDDDDDDDDNDDDNVKDVMRDNDEVSLHSERRTLVDKKVGSAVPIGKKESHLVGARWDRKSAAQKKGRQTRKQVGKKRSSTGSKQQSKPVGRRGSNLSRSSSRGKRDLSSANYRNQTKKSNYKVMLQVKYRGQPSLNRKRIARAAELSNNWHCEMKTQWKKMQEDYYPAYVQTGRCVSKSCFFNMYRCIPKKYTIRVLKRDPNRCNPIPTFGLNTTYEERWIFERYHVTVCCQCGSSKRKTPRRRKKKRPRHR